MLKSNIDVFVATSFLCSLARSGFYCFIAYSILRGVYEKKLNFFYVSVFVI